MLFHIFNVKADFALYVLVSQKRESLESFFGNLSFFGGEGKEMSGNRRLFLGGDSGRFLPLAPK